jgi:hypothetical protein
MNNRNTSERMRRSALSLPNVRLMTQRIKGTSAWLPLAEEQDWLDGEVPPAKTPAE